MLALSFLENRHAGALGLDDFVAGGNIVHSVTPDVACEVVDLLHATVLQGDLLAVEIIGITFAVCI